MYRNRPWLRYITEPEGSTEPSGPASTQAPAAPAAQPTATPPAPQPEQPTEPPKVTDPDGNVDWKAAARKHEDRFKAADKRANETKTQLDAIRAALGLDGNDKVDPDKLAADLNAARGETTNLRVENAVLRAAAANGANPDALTDSRSFMTTVTKLDPTSPTFDKDVAKAITDAVKAHPGLAATPTVPQASGAEINGAGAPADIDAQIADAQKRGALGEVIALKQRKYLSK